jgi:hypothetical protein
LSVIQATEIDYELHSLGWKAFQNLSITVASEIWGQVIQSYFDSNDGGRDGAFHGAWTPQNQESFDGSYTIQCKFTSNKDKLLTLSNLKDELVKADRLAKEGLANTYILFANAKLTGVNAEKIQSAFLKISGINHFSVYGRERISQIIHSSPKLRMLVPRIYGLGDLSQILDERAYNQAQDILSSLGDDLAKFIITKAYEQSAKALSEHGFVLLLGDPMCGKSTIAAALAVGALDEWQCETIKVRDADDFVKHSNPHEKQLFWIDDAFGATQFDWGMSSNWSRTFPHVSAAIKRGSKVIFTSRSYIYRAATKYLKQSALPVINESQVVIHVEDLTKEEKDQILYNHIKLGSQLPEFKTEIKPFLNDIADHQKFSPEIARRLGNPIFTKNLHLSKFGLSNFVEKPLEMLCEIINTIGDSSRSALALVFLRGGNLPSPLCMTPEEKQAITKLGGDVTKVVDGLESLKDSLLLNVHNENQYAWKFKHPTVQDAFASIVASSPDLMDIYLTGASLNKILNEVSCGKVGIWGASVIIPSTLYDGIMSKLDTLNLDNWRDKDMLCRFLTYRCDKNFLQLYLNRHPNFISTLSASSNLSCCYEIDVIATLHQLNLLPEAERLRNVQLLRSLAVEIPDAGFISDNIKSIFNKNEFLNILQLVKNQLLPNIEDVINKLKYDYNGDEGDDPDTYFESLRETCNEYKSVFEEDKTSILLLNEALTKIEWVIEGLLDDYPEHQNSGDLYTKKDEVLKTSNSLRSIYDDVDI